MFIPALRPYCSKRGDRNRCWRALRPVHKRGTCSPAHGIAAGAPAGTASERRRPHRKCGVRGAVIIAARTSRDREEITRTAGASARVRGCKAEDVAAPAIAGATPAPIGNAEAGPRAGSQGEKNRE